MDNRIIASAVAGILAAAAAPATFAQPPTAAQAAAAKIVFYVSGSSAAAAGFAAAVGADLCGGSSNLSQFTTVPSTATTSTPDFRAYSCTSAGGTSKAGGTIPFGGSLVTIYYRAEGGSVTGVFPVINDTSINFLDLSTACTGTAGTQLCTVGGTSAGNGPSDSFTSGVAKHASEFGISDLEPAVFGAASGTFKHAGAGHEDPSGVYTTSFIGPDQTQQALSAMSQTRLFQQTFGIIANSNLGITDISSDAVQAILAGTVTDWGLIPTSSGSSVASAGTTIVVCQRDLGSGTRSGADVYFTQDGCNVVSPGTALTDRAGKASQPAADNYSTLEELACVQGHSNSIGYVSIDNETSTHIGSGAPFPSVVGLTLNGITPSNLGTATGAYQFAFEASGNDNPTAQAANTNAAVFYPYLKKVLQNVNTAPQAVDINALAFVGNKPSANVSGTKVGSIYISAYDRGGNSCKNQTTEL